MVGPCAIVRLRADTRVPEGVCLIEGGTLGLELLTYIWDATYLFVLDALARCGASTRNNHSDLGRGAAFLAGQRQHPSTGLGRSPGGEGFREAATGARDDIGVVRSVGKQTVCFVRSFFVATRIV